MSKKIYSYVIFSNKPMGYKAMVIPSNGVNFKNWGKVEDIFGALNLDVTSIDEVLQDTTSLDIKVTTDKKINEIYIGSEKVEDFTTTTENGVTTVSIPKATIESIMENEGSYKVSVSTEKHTVATTITRVDVSSQDAQLAKDYKGVLSTKGSVYEFTYASLNNGSQLSDDIEIECASNEVRCYLKSDNAIKVVPLVSSLSSSVDITIKVPTSIDGKYVGSEVTLQLTSLVNPNSSKQQYKISLSDTSKTINYGETATITVSGDESSMVTASNLTYDKTKAVVTYADNVISIKPLVCEEVSVVLGVDGDTTHNAYSATIKVTAQKVNWNITVSTDSVEVDNGASATITLDGEYEGATVSASSNAITATLEGATVTIVGVADSDSETITIAKNADATHKAFSKVVAVKVNHIEIPKTDFDITVDKESIAMETGSVATLVVSGEDKAKVTLDAITVEGADDEFILSYADDTLIINAEKAFDGKITIAVAEDDTHNAFNKEVALTITEKVVEPTYAYYGWNEFVDEESECYGIIPTSVEEIENAETTKNDVTINGDVQNGKIISNKQDVTTMTTTTPLHFASGTYYCAWVAVPTGYTLKAYKDQACSQEYTDPLEYFNCMLNADLGFSVDRPVTDIEGYTLYYFAQSGYIPEVWVALVAE